MQVSSLATSLPTHWASSVHVAVDADRFDVLRALILPDSSTPYAFGAFLFDIYFPPMFPAKPPQVPLRRRTCGHPAAPVATDANLQPTPSPLHVHLLQSEAACSQHTARSAPHAAGQHLMARQPT